MTSILALLLALGCFVVAYCCAAGPGGHGPTQAGNPPEARLVSRIFFGGGLILLGLGAWLAL